MTHRRTGALRAMLAGTTAVVGLMTAGGAFAQTQVEELVVTAEKREVNIQDVPAAVSAISGETLVDLGVSRLVDYAQYLPGFNVSDGGSPGQATVTMRGIAAVGPGSVVGYYLDDTPIGSSGNYARATIFALDMLPYDLERFEVLRGPQGTLYGAGTMGGLVKYVLKDANPDKFTAQVGGDLMGTHNGGLGYGVRGALNIPLGENFAVRLSAYNQETAGYTDNVMLGLEGTNDVSQSGGRVAATWEPTENLTVNFNALWSRLESDDNAQVTLGPATTHPIPGGGVIFDGDPIYGELAQNHPFLQPFSKDIDYYSATINWDAGPVSVVSATSWSKTKTFQVTDASYSFGQYPLIFGIPAGFSRFDLNLELDKFTQEIRLISPSGGRFEWVAGGFYTREESVNEQLALVFDTSYVPIPGPIFQPFFAYAKLPSTYREMAAFGNLTWNISEKFDVTGGVRFAYNSQVFKQISDGLILGGFTQQPGESQEDVTTWMVNARYRFTDDIMAYGRIATGYRPGGPNIAFFGAKPTVNSDTLTSYEAGLKATFLEGRVLLNASAFNIQWEGIQLTVTDPTQTVSYLDNAGDAFSRGFEIEGVWIPVDGLRLGFNAAYTKAELTDLVPGSAPYIIGYQLPGVPELTAGLTAEYGWNVSGDWRATVGGGARYVGEQYNQAITVPGYASDTMDEAYATLDLRAGVSNDRYSVNVWVRNATDERVYTGKIALQNPIFGTYNNFYSGVLQPRTVGVTFDASF